MEFTENMNSCSVVIPVYRGANTIPTLIERLIKTLPDNFDDYEILLINDGSPDNSWQVIQHLAQENQKIIGVNLRRNFGQHNALLCGIRLASKQLVLTMDDDLQHPPEEMGKLIAALTPEIDVVYGLPTVLPHSAWRNAFSRLTKRMLAKVMNLPTVRDLSSYRLFRTDIRSAFATYQNPGVIIDVLLSWGTSRFATTNIHEEPRTDGKSNYRFSTLVTQALLILTGFSTIPLRFAVWLGFLFLLFGFLTLIYVLLVTIIHGSIPGFPFLSSLIIIFSGVQLFSLGLFGEYLGRIFDSSMQRPPYVIGEVTKK